MSDVLTVQTPFGDIADLAQGFIGRVTAQQLVVNVAQPVAPGEQVRFQVLLADGTLAFWGDGQCAQIQDHGDAVGEHERFELLLHTLSFPDERSQPVFEYMVSLSESATPSDELTATEEGFASEAPTGEVDTGELEALDAASVPPEDLDAGSLEEAPEALDASAASGAPDALEGYVATEDAAAEFVEESAPAYEEAAAYEEAPQYQAASQRPAAMIADDDVAPRAISNHPGPPPGGVLTRLSSGNNWAPVRPEKVPPMPRSGLFAYPFGPLPVPARPPRPELDASLRVRPAPRPAAQ